MKNSELLNTSKNLLTRIDKQRQFILRTQSMRMPCPNCGHHLNVFEAKGIDIDDYDTGSIMEGKAHCTQCKRRLRYVVPLIATGGHWYWELVPSGETRD